MASELYIGARIAAEWRRANETAEKLFESLLSPTQRAEWKQDEAICIRGPRGWYLLEPGRVVYRPDHGAGPHVVMMWPDVQRGTWQPAANVRTAILLTAVHRAEELAIQVERAYAARPEEAERACPPVVRCDGTDPAHRATLLLESLLDEDQLAEWRRERRITVSTRLGLFELGRYGDIRFIEAAGQGPISLCVDFDVDQGTKLPEEDLWIACLLFLRHSPGRFLAESVAVTDP